MRDDYFTNQSRPLLYLKSSPVGRGRARLAYRGEQRDPSAVSRELRPLFCKKSSEGRVVPVDGRVRLSY